jgi:Zn-finger nucleic acid-binding protein
MVKAYGTEMSHCASCEGYWLSPSLLRKLVEEALTMKLTPEELAVAHNWCNTSAMPAQEKRGCPDCHATMLTENYGQSSGVFIDRCPNSCGFWFDRDELDKVVIYNAYIQKGLFREHDNVFQKIARFLLNLIDKKEK